MNNRYMNNRCYNPNAYTNFTKEMNLQDWYSTPSIITQHNIDIVHTDKVKKHTYEAFLGIKIPVGDYSKLISFCSIEQHSIKNNNLPHRLAIRCIDDNGNELDSLSQIDIDYYSYNPSAGIPTGVIDNITNMDLVDRLHHHFVDRIRYGDISYTKGSRYKQRDEKYFLKHQGICLVGGDQLLFGVFNLNVNIAEVELFMECDIWKKQK